MNDNQSLIPWEGSARITGRAERESRRHDELYQLISASKKLAMGRISMIQTHAEQLINRTTAIADLTRRTIPSSRKLSPAEEVAHNERFQSYLTLMNQLVEAAGVEIVLAATTAPSNLVNRSLPDVLEELDRWVFGSR